MDFSDFTSFATDLHHKLRGPEEFQLYSNNDKPFEIEENRTRRAGNK